MGFTAAAVLLLPVLPMRVDAQTATWRLSAEPAVQIGVEDGDLSGGRIVVADNLWVMDYRTRPDTESAWTVMSRSGVELARVRMPARFTAMQITRDHVLGVRRDELGVEYVQLWAFRRSS